MTCVRCKSNINVSTDRYWTNWGDIFCLTKTYPFTIKYEHRKDKL